MTVHGPRGTEARPCRATTTEVHKVKVGGWAQDRYQNRSENLWEANARQVAEVVESGIKRVAAQVVVVTGDVRARTALVDSLGEHARSLVVQLESGTRHEGGDEEKLRAEVEEAVARVAAGEDQAVIDRFGEARGRAGSGVGSVLAVAGLSDTVGALRAAAVGDAARPRRLVLGRDGLGRSGAGAHRADRGRADRARGPGPGAGPAGRRAGAGRRRHGRRDRHAARRASSS